MKAPACALLLAACGAAPAPVPQETVTILQLDQLEVVNGKGRYTGEIGERRATIGFAVPVDRIDPARGHGSDRVGATEDGVVVLVDRYATRVSGPDDRCAADGREA